MPIVRRRPTDIDRATVVADFAARPRPTESEIQRHAAEDGDAWTDDDLENAVLVSPPLKADEIKAVRQRLGLSQAQFAHRFGFRLDTFQQYEQGRRVPSGPAATLLRVIAANPDAVTRALRQRFVVSAK